MFYIYTNDTNEYLKTTEGQVDPKNPGSHLTPAFSTTLPPLAPVPNKVAIFNGVIWVYGDDYRNELIYNETTREEKTQETLGDLEVGYKLKSHYQLDSWGRYWYFYNPDGSPDHAAIDAHDATLELAEKKRQAITNIKDTNMCMIDTFITLMSNPQESAMRTYREESLAILQDTSTTLPVVQGNTKLMEAFDIFGLEY